MSNECVASDISVVSAGSNARTGPLAELRAGRQLMQIWHQGSLNSWNAKETEEQDRKKLNERPEWGQT
jgi:hypothetical protein